jgi:hypothetical protein
MAARPRYPAILVVLVLAATAVARGAAAVPSTITLPDPVGDAASGAADIRSIAIGDDGLRNLTLAVDLANRPKGLRGDDFVHIFLDTDESMSTGYDGFDYGLEADGRDQTAGLFRWDGSEWTLVEASTLRASRTGVRLWINARDLDSTTGIRTSFDTNRHSNPRARDAAGPLVFTPSSPQAAAPQLRVVRLTSLPSPPRSGRELDVGLALERVDTGGLVVSGVISCSAHVGTTRLKVVRRPYFFESLGAALFGEPSRALCGWKVPPGSGGRTIEGSIAVGWQGLEANQPFMFRIR